MALEDDHHHCKVCGKVCPPDREVCSSSCRQRREAMTRTRRNYTYLLYGMIIFFVLLLVLGFFRV